MIDKETFAQRLQELAPSKEELRRFDVDEQFIEFFRARFFCTPKPRSNNRLLTDATVLSLLQDFDCSKVEIAIITFLLDPVEGVTHYIFGNAEQDILALNKISGEIEVLDYADNTHVIWSCASSGESFLEALLVSAEYLTNKLKSDNSHDKETYLFQHCVDVAGGHKYANFYQMLLGFYNSDS
jgi:hypothetical protein